MPDISREDAKKLYSYGEAYYGENRAYPIDPPKELQTVKDILADIDNLHKETKTMLLSILAAIVGETPNPTDDDDDTPPMLGWLLRQKSDALDIHGIVSRIKEVLW